MRVPVSARIPRAIISRTIEASAALVAGSTHRSEVTDTTLPGNGPGIPGVAAGACGVTTRTGGTAGVARADERRRRQELHERASVHRIVLPLRLRGDHRDERLDVAEREREALDVAGVAFDLAARGPA